MPAEGERIFPEDPLALPVRLAEANGVVEVVAPRKQLRFLEGALLAFFLVLMGAAIALLALAMAIFGDVPCPSGATCTTTLTGDLPRGAILAISTGLGLLLAGVGLAAAYGLAIKSWGEEFLRLDGAGVTHGYRLRGRERMVEWHVRGAIDGFECRPGLGFGPALVPLHLGKPIGERATMWFAGARASALAEIASRLADAIRSLPPPDAVLPARVRVVETPEGGVIEAWGARWSQFSLGVFASLVLGAFIGLPLAYALYAGNVAVAALLAALCLYPVGILVYVFLTVGPTRTRVVVSPREIRIERGPWRRVVRLKEDPRIAIDDRDVLVLTKHRRARLGFERLDPAERPAVQRVVERLVTRAARSG